MGEESVNPGAVLTERDIYALCIQIERARWPESKDVQAALDSLERRINSLRPNA